MRALAALAALVVLAAWGVPVGAQVTEYSFDAAQQRAARVSAGLAGAEASLDASRSRAAALGSGHLPVVSLSAQYLRYRKTVDIALGDLRDQVQASIDGFLASLPIPAGPLPGQVLGGVIPDTQRVRVTDNVWRPTLTVAWPLYTGGAIEAGQDAAAAGVRQAEAEVRSAQDALTLQLVLAYFGQQLSAQTLQTSRENLERFSRHLDDARKLEAQGMLARGQRLQVEVARNAAERQALRAQNDHDGAQALLGRLLQERGAVQPTTPLFVASAPLPPPQRFIEEAAARSPTLARLRALRDAAQRGVQAARAELLPKVYAFGSYNFNARHALLPDPDWMVGIGIHYTITGSVDRRQSEAAALARVRQAEAAQEQAARDLESAIERAWHGAETARQQFLLLEANLTAAQESVRVQTIAFREGESTAAALIDAQVALSVAQTQRAAAAFEYDVGLAQLLAASGGLADYGMHIAQADARLPVVRVAGGAASGPSTTVAPTVPETRP